MESDALISTMLNAVDAEQSRATMETDRASDCRIEGGFLVAAFGRMLFRRNTASL